MGLLYAFNTTGAIFGTLAAGFLLIGSFGMAAAIAIAALCQHPGGPERAAARRSGAAHARRRQRSQHGSRATRRDRWRLVAFWAFAVSGAVSLAYEVVWSRILAILFDSTIYGFVLMLATVLPGHRARQRPGGPGPARTSARARRRSGLRLAGDRHRRGRGGVAGRVRRRARWLVGCASSLSSRRW